MSDALTTGGGRRAGFTLWMLVTLWVVVLFDPQWLLAAYGNRMGLDAPKVLFAAFAVLLVLGVMNVSEWRKRWTWYAPLFCFLLSALFALPLQVNLERSQAAIQFIVLMWILIVGTVTLVDSVPRVESLLWLYASQFVVFGLWGASTGLIYWHPFLANYDGFGPFMVIGAGLSSFLIAATDNVKLRRLMIVSVAVAAVGVVASFARGAFLGALVVAGLVWLRAPRKGLALVAGIGCAVVVAVAASVLFGGAYWEEMSTILHGTEEQTGEDRWAMWTAAVGVWRQHPLFGVGIDNWGAFAASFYRPGELEGNYFFNPGALYGRSAHNQYVTVLAEQGLVGVAAFAWIFIDFWRRNIAMRSAAAVARWKELGGRLNLRHVALGLEAAVVGWMAAAALYSMRGVHWLYTLLALNLLIHSFVRSATPSSPPAGLAGHRGRPARMPAPHHARLR